MLHLIHLLSHSKLPDSKFKFTLSYNVTVKSLPCPTINFYVLVYTMLVSIKRLLLCLPFHILTQIYRPHKTFHQIRNTVEMYR